MMTLRRNADRRHVQHGDHQTWYTFHRQDHPDAVESGAGVLIDFNEVLLPPGAGTVPYPGMDAEIVTYVFQGALAQEDSSGRSSVIRAGAFQRSATSPGVHYVATNASPGNWSHLFQIFLRPSHTRFDHPTECKHFTAAQRRNGLCLVASPDGRSGSLRVFQNVLISSIILDLGHHFFYALPPGRSAWLHVLHGEASMHELVLGPGDSVSVTLEPAVSLTVQESTELLLVEFCARPRASLETRHCYGVKPVGDAEGDATAARAPAGDGTRWVVAGRR